MKLLLRLTLLLVLFFYTASFIGAQSLTDTFTLRVFNSFWKTGASMPVEGLTFLWSDWGGSDPYIETIQASDSSSFDVKFVPASIAGESCFTGIKHGAMLNGITVADLAAMAKHVTGVEPLSPFGLVAADVNGSNSVNTFDIVELKKLILGIYNELPSTNDNWIVLPADFASTHEPCVKLPAFPTALIDTTQLISVKLGDVDGDANPLGNFNGPVNNGLTLALPNTTLQQGEVAWVPVVLTSEAQLAGFQLGFQFDESFLKIKSIKSNVFNTTNTSEYLGQGEFEMISLTPNVTAEAMVANQSLFDIQIEAIQTCNLSQVFSLNQQRLTSYWIDAALVIHPFDTTLALVSAQFEPQSFGVHIGTPTPNPFSDYFSIPVSLPNPETIYLELSDATGKRVELLQFDLPGGSQSLEISTQKQLPTGLVFYRIWSENWSTSGKMLHL